MKRVLPKVLFVDDEPKVLAGIKRQLYGEFEVLTAESGPAGLQVLFAEKTCLVVVSDMRMPDMDGIQFLTKVWELRPETKRILLTGSTDAHVAASVVSTGLVFRCLLKPCPIEVLIETLREGFQYHESSEKKVSNANC